MQHQEVQAGGSEVRMERGRVALDAREVAQIHGRRDRLHRPRRLFGERGLEGEDCLVDGVLSPSGDDDARAAGRERLGGVVPRPGVPASDEGDASCVVEGRFRVSCGTQGPGQALSVASFCFHPGRVWRAHP